MHSVQIQKSRSEKDENNENFIKLKAIISKIEKER